MDESREGGRERSGLTWALTHEARPRAREMDGGDGQRGGARIASPRLQSGRVVSNDERADGRRGTTYAVWWERGRSGIWCAFGL